mgnify:CR=1 FL=1|tara:strand:+ start:12242 stop:12805 length:564 start_codon:yes stop_codon:yes gene_type:complete
MARRFSNEPSEEQRTMAMLAGLRKTSSLPQVMDMLNKRRTQERSDKTSQQQMLESQSRVAESEQRLAHGPIGLRQLAAREQQHKQSMEQAEKQYRDTLAFNRQRNIETQAQAAETNKIRLMSALGLNRLRALQGAQTGVETQSKEAILNLMRGAGGGSGGEANRPGQRPLNPAEMEYLKQQQQLDQQ